jgi:general secretion pathway protein N
MVKLLRITGLVVLSGLGLTTGWVVACHAATSATLDILPNDITAPPDRVEVGNLRPLTGPKPNAAKPPVGGNPLWSVPLSVLTATQERPVFSASRRPPPRAIAGPRIEPLNVPAVKTAEPEHPPLVLIGAVVGESDAIAVFLDRTSQGVVRLRTGETHSGWELSSVLPREVTLRKADQVEVLALQRPADSPAAAGSPVSPIQPAQAFQPANGGYAPFSPRSTPKNGEADGL